ncbi:MAG: flagellar motor protein MotB, partial [Flavobacterium sp.]
MKTNIKNSVFATLLVLVSITTWSQNRGAVSADKKFNNYSYVDAIATYEKVAEKGYKDEKMFRKLGDSYYFIADLAAAEKWYTELFAMNQEQQPEYYYRYAQTLKAVGQYEKANQILTKFTAVASGDQRAKLFSKQKDYLEDIKANSGRFTIADAGINSPYSDYGSSYYDNSLLFASARDTGGIAKKVFKWDNSAFTNLYSAPLNDQGNANDPKLFNKIINTKFHESTPIFTKDGSTMYFTRNNYLNGRKQKDKSRVTLLKLYKATKQDGKWVNVQELPFNSNEYSVAHPTLSLDEKLLYFASDMPGTKGLSDLWYVTIDSDGSYGIPQNLGTSINTEGRETFPFIAADNTLYFASDGHPGLGGLDVFSSKI